MTPIMNMQRARLTALMVSGTFMVIHAILFAFFYRYHVLPMMSFNIFSILFYFVLLLISLKRFYWFFPGAVYLEVLAHMTAATYFTGWNSGFQVTLIAMCALIAYCEYIGKILNIKGIKAVPMNLACMIVYLVLCGISFFRPAPYPLPVDVCYRMQMFWGFTSFIIMIIILSAFVRITVNSEEYLSKQAGHDRLTGLPNRYFLLNHLEAVQAAGDLPGHWLVMIDIDDFKMINDTYGHNCGDAILVQIADLLQKDTAEYTACRWDGEEFILVGRVRESSETCIKKIDVLRSRIMNNTFIYNDLRLHLTVTAGYAEYRDGMTIDQWVDAADRKLYTGKKNGKNQLAV